MTFANLEIVVWIPVVVMLIGMMIWGVVIWGVNRHPKVREFNNKYSVFGYGCLVMTVVTLVYLVFKSLTSPIMRPINEVAPRLQRPVAEVEVEMPTELENKTLQAKPKDVINSQPETPLVDKAVKNVQEK